MKTIITDEQLLAAAAAATAPASPAASTTTPAPTIKKVKFGGIAKKAKEEKAEYPVFPDPTGEAAIITARIIDRVEQQEALDGVIKTDKAELKQMVNHFLFTSNAGKAEVSSSIKVKSPTGNVLVVFQNKYTKLTDDTALAPVPFAVPYFRQAYTFEIDGDQISADVAPAIMAGLEALFALHGCEAAIVFNESFKPLPEFHTARHSKLTPAENLALDQVVQCVAMVKTKGVK